MTKSDFDGKSKKDNIIVDLKSKLDRDGQKFYIGRIEAPVLIDCSKGAVFLIFVSDTGEEQLQIASKDQKEFKKYSGNNFKSED